MADQEERWEAAWVAAVLLLVLVVSGVLLWRWRVATTRTEGTRIISVSRLAGKEYQPAVAPDGQTVAFLWQQESTRPPRIWIQPADDSSPRPLTSEPGEYSSPAWSPDGRSIACLRFHDAVGELLILPAGGGSGRSLVRVLPTRFGLAHRHIDWSPNGEIIALDDADNLKQPLGIYVISVRTGERKRLTQPDPLTIGDIAPRFSADGRTLSFIRVVSRISQQLFTVPAAGGAAVPIDESPQLISDHAWAADGKSLIFASNREGEYRIWKTKASASKTPPVPHATAVYGEFAIQFSLAPKSSALVYAVLQDRINVWRFDLAAEADPAVRWKRVVASAGQDRSPQYSPDGKRIAFRSDRSGYEDIWVEDPESEEVVRVTHDRIQPSVPRWSPDGRTLVFNGVSSLDIYLATDHGASWDVRKFGATGVHPVFSTDGQWIYAGTDNAIVRYPASGGAPETVHSGRGLSLGVSPDGKYLYFVRATKETSLWRLDLETHEITEAVQGLVPYCGSCWAAAPAGIYYLGTFPGEPNQQAIFYRDFAASDSKLIARYPEAVFPIGIGPFSLSPDRRYFLTVRLDSSDSDLLRVDQFR